jgi:hypothetical protein
MVNARTLNLLMSNRQRTYSIVKIPKEKRYKSKAAVWFNKIAVNYRLAAQLPPCGTTTALQRNYRLAAQLPPSSATTT